VVKKSRFAVRENKERVFQERGDIDKVIAIGRTTFHG
jgi:hypothetical protein